LRSRSLTGRSDKQTDCRPRKWLLHNAHVSRSIADDEAGYRQPSRSSGQAEPQGTQPIDPGRRRHDTEPPCRARAVVVRPAAAPPTSFQRMRRQLGRATCSCWYYWNEKHTRCIIHGRPTCLRACSLRLGLWRTCFSPKRTKLVALSFFLLFGFACETS